MATEAPPAPITAPPAPTAPAPSPTPTAPPVPAGATPSIAQPPTPSAPAKKGSARERMRDDLAKIAKPANGAVEPKAPAPAPAAAEPKPGTPAAAEPGKDGKPPGKESPWKLVDRYKGRVTELESEIAKLKTTPVSQEDRKTFEERVTKAEARAKELEEHMRFVDYAKTDDFKTKYVQPYEKAWANAVSELKEITITDGAGHERPVSAQDILDLVNLPLGKAREIADTSFGKFADDVMNHRKEIRKLFDAQQQALEEAKKNGGETLKQQQETSQKNIEALRNTIKTEWDTENAALLADKQFGPLFSKREGDEAWNQRLQNGFELVDKAFSQNPSDPNLKPEQRQAIIRLHTAVRNRAAAWGAVRAENDVLRGQIEEMRKELDQYKGSEPGTAGGRISGNGAGSGKPMTARERMHEELRRRSKPA